jgi:hypothetical protein
MANVAVLFRLLRYAMAYVGNEPVFLKKRWNPFFHPAFSIAFFYFQISIVG